MKNLKLGKKFAPIALTGTLVLVGFTGATKVIENRLNRDVYFSNYGGIVKEDEVDLDWLNIVAACAISGTVGFKIGKKNRKVNCNVKEFHLHKYVSEEGFVTYKEGELLENEGMFWTVETVTPNEELLMMCKYDLLKIDDNVEALENATKNDFPYTEYEYKVTHYLPVKAGKVCTMIPSTSWYFTTDTNECNLTGNVRDVDYKYIGYRIGKTKDGKRALVKSKLVDNLLDIKDRYPYFKLSNYKNKVYSEVYSKDKKLVK